jgi:predicted restriction endonuclease
MQRACLDCGAITDQARCPRHRNGSTNATSWNGQRDRTAQARFRRQVLDRDGHQCVYTTPDGRRCTTTSPLQAHHVRPGYDLDAGVTLCRTHHRLIDPKAR